MKCEILFSLEKQQQQQFFKYFIFPENRRHFMRQISMTCQSPFSGKNQKTTNLSAEFGKRGKED